MVDWTAAIEMIRAHRHFLVTTHFQADGDAVGSEQAMAMILRQLGKDVVILNDDPVPRNYRFLDPQNGHEVFDAARSADRLARCEVAVVLDCGAWSRLGRLGEALREMATPILCIDHHRSNEGFGPVCVIDESACAVGEMVYDLAGAVGVQVDAAMASALFVAIGTDTGWFRFSNTTARAFELAVELMKRGASPHELYSHVYDNLRPERLRLLSQALETLRYECCGRLAWFKITREMFQQCGADEEDVEGFVDVVRCVRGVEVVILFREGPDGRTKVSLRSKGEADVGKIAGAFGGGGHARAAGIRFRESLDESIEKVLARARHHLGRTG